MLTLAVWVGAPTVAMAAVSVAKASLSSGTLFVEGRGALSNATITVSSPESIARGTSDRDGKFKFSASGYRSSTCRATVTDGSTSATVSLSGCTPSSTTSPAPSAQLTPVSDELGPGFVGSDFTTFSSTTTTITFGPDTLGPVRFEIIAGQLPDGLRLVDPNAGFTPAKSIHASVSGTPTTVQVSTFTIKATDANGLQDSRTYTIRINPPRTLDFISQGTPALTVGTFSNWWFEGAGGVKPYRWAVTAGQLPPGMSLIQDNPDGPLVRVGGTPTTAGSFTFTLGLTDAGGATVSRTFTATVSAGDTSPPPAAPTLVAPADGASVTLPFTIDWTATFDPTLSANGGYNWQVGTTSTFSTVALRDSTRPDVTEATISALASGTYFWRVQAVDGQLRSSEFSQPRSFTVAAAATEQPAPAAGALAVSPTSVTGGGSATGTVTLTSAAPSGGAAVSLASSAPHVAAVPTTVTVPAGATSATFPVSTSSVTATTSATISGTYGGVTRSTTLTVTPPAQAAVLTVTATGRSGERITSSPAGIDVAVGSTGSASFPAGTAITLSVTNSREAVWSGACSSGGNKARTCRFTLNGSATVTGSVQ